MKLHGFLDMVLLDGDRIPNKTETALHITLGKPRSHSFCVIGFQYPDSFFLSFSLYWAFLIWNFSTPLPQAMHAAGSLNNASRRDPMGNWETTEKL